MLDIAEKSKVKYSEVGIEKNTHGASSRLGSRWGDGKCPNKFFQVGKGKQLKMGLVLYGYYS